MAGVKSIKFVVSGSPIPVADGSTRSYHTLGPMKFYDKNGDPLPAVITTHGNTSGNGTIQAGGKSVNFTATASGMWSNTANWYKCTYPIAAAASANGMDIWCGNLTAANAIGAWWQIEFDEAVPISHMTLATGTTRSANDSYMYDVFINGNIMPVAKGVKNGAINAPTNIVLSKTNILVRRDGKLYYRRRDYLRGKSVRKIAITVTKVGATNVSGMVGFGGFSLYHDQDVPYNLAITTHGRTSGAGIVTDLDTAFTINAASAWENGASWYCTYPIQPRADTATGYDHNWLPKTLGSTWALEFALPLPVAALSFNSPKGIFGGGEYKVVIDDDEEHAEVVSFPPDARVEIS